jgi:DNA-3-methyladenine glycosylase I
MAKELQRCAWIAGDLMQIYHDEEWGVPLHDDQKLFEFVVLESAQAGLSWRTILQKREGYRKNFADFDPEKVARFTPKRVDKILLDPGIVRNRAKVEATVNNARAFLAIQVAFGSFDKYIWDFVDGKPINNRWATLKEIPATTDLSDTISKDLKQRGFKFMGSTVVYAHMQATGMVNDHVLSCYRHKIVAKLK